MAKQISPETKYAVRLGILANSFYDPECAANLFRSTPCYFFNHKPTKAIINGVLGGKLIDLKGNIDAGNGLAKAVSQNPNSDSNQEIIALQGKLAVLEQEKEALQQQVTIFEKENQSLRAQIVEKEETLDQNLKADKKAAKKKGSDEE